MQIITTYKHIKHGYVKRMNNGDLFLSIPRWKRFDAGFKERLLEKGKKLHAHQKKITTLYRQTHTHVSIRGKEIPKTQLPTALDSYLRKLCFDEATRIADIYSQRLGIPYTTLRIKKVKTKRGSCSSKQNININLDLVHLDPIFLEYVVIHEVCHLKHKHHQRPFWNEVAIFYPKYKEIISRMRHIRLSNIEG